MPECPTGVHGEEDMERKMNVMIIQCGFVLS
jgi:hypothetical protein